MQNQPCLPYNDPQRASVIGVPQSACPNFHFDPTSGVIFGCGGIAYLRIRSCDKTPFPTSCWHMWSRKKNNIYIYIYGRLRILVEKRKDKPASKRGGASAPSAQPARVMPKQPPSAPCCARSVRYCNVAPVVSCALCPAHHRLA